MSKASTSLLFGAMKIRKSYLQIANLLCDEASPIHKLVSNVDSVIPNSIIHNGVRHWWSATVVKYPKDYDPLKDTIHYLDPSVQEAIANLFVSDDYLRFNEDQSRFFDFDDVDNKFYESTFLGNILGPMIDRDVEAVNLFSQSGLPKGEYFVLICEWCQDAHCLKRQAPRLHKSKRLSLIVQGQVAKEKKKTKGKDDSNLYDLDR